MKTLPFIILIIVIIMGTMGILADRYVKQQKEINDSQNRKIERIYEKLGLE